MNFHIGIRWTWLYAAHEAILGAPAHCRGGELVWSMTRCRARATFFFFLGPSNLPCFYLTSNPALCCLSLVHR